MSEDQKDNTVPLTAEKIQLRLGDLANVMTSEHPNSKKFKEVAVEVDKLNAALEVLEAESDEKKEVAQKETPVEGVKQCSLQECLQMERKQKDLAAKEAAEKED